MSTTNVPIPQRPRRAKSSGISLNEFDAALIKGMLQRGDRQHDVASYFGVDSGRISEIATGRRFADVAAAAPDELPPSGPYLARLPSSDVGRALADARIALERLEKLFHDDAH